MRKPDDSPADIQDENIGLLLDLITKYDPDRQFLPTSASGTREFRHDGVDDNSQCHDVHGPWKFDLQDYYNIYNRTTCQLHSEFGVDSVTNLEALKRFLPEKDRQPFSSSQNEVWRHHGAWWDTLYRDSQLFGSFESGSLEQFVKCSQFVQYEGIRYALNANHQIKYVNCGSIVWQLNEPWPNSSCTNLVDYYGLPKLGYYALKEAYRPLAPSVRYEKLIWQPGETVIVEQYVCNDSKAVSGMLEVSVSAGNGTLVLTQNYPVTLETDTSQKVGQIQFVSQDNEWYTVKQTLRCDNREIHSEYWLFSLSEGQTIDKQIICRLYDLIQCRGR